MPSGSGSGCGCCGGSGSGGPCGCTITTLPSYTFGYLVALAAGGSVSGTTSGTTVNGDNGYSGLPCGPDGYIGALFNSGDGYYHTTYSGGPNAGQPVYISGYLYACCLSGTWTVEVGLYTPQAPPGTGGPQFRINLTPTVTCSGGTIHLSVSGTYTDTLTGDVYTYNGSFS